VPETCHQVGTAAPLPSETRPARATVPANVAADVRVLVDAVALRARSIGPRQCNPEGRQAMNFFILGKLAEIRIRSLVDGAEEDRKTRCATFQRFAPRFKHHFHWPKECVIRPPQAAG